MDTGLEKPPDPLISPQPFSLQLEKQFIYFVFFGGFFFLVKCIIHPHPPSWWGISFAWGPSKW